ncbi:DUF7678 domain-containing protein [Dyadobacter sandarakinus]|nr:hypothetical protein [Dyadobacter sandarakinus]
MQISRLRQLSDFDGIDPAEHAKRAIDTYLKSQQPAPPPDHDKIQAQVSGSTDDPNISGAFWVSGIVNQYEFSGLILRHTSKTAMERGRISKLSIWDPAVREATNNFIGSCIVNYDRGWDIRPSLSAEPIFLKVKSLIESYIAR